ncbi:LysE family translocator [Micromonospora sp. STR1_7]|uniref:LysE family translocator n=1 Tax=Micromonospora parastrephiae TaxID=2806101 RepID=A0ABS1XRY1_9ACTN|nr:LysE family translocator [Micromonospora parastrephiae]
MRRATKRWRSARRSGCRRTPPCLGVVLGIQTGTLAWGVLTSAGVTALLTASHLAYEVLRWAGACHLIWMGLSMLLAHPPPSTRPIGPTDRRTRDGRHRLLPRAAARRTDEFTEPEDGRVLRRAPTSVHPLRRFPVHLLGTAWSAVLVVLARRLRTVLQRPTARRLMDRVTGTVITGFGIRLATSSH